MKKIFLTITCTLAFTFIFGQVPSFFAEENNGHLFVNHSINGNETFLSLALLYRQSPNEIAKFNGLRLGAELQPDQIIKIPVNKNNLNTTGINDFNHEIIHPLLLSLHLKQSIHVFANKYGLDENLIRKLNPGFKKEINAGQKFQIGYLRTITKYIAVAIEKPAINTTVKLVDDLKILSDSIKPYNKATVSYNKPKTDEPKESYVAKKEQPVLNITENRQEGSVINISNNKENEVARLTNQDIGDKSSDQLFQLARKKAFDEKDYKTALFFLTKALEKSPDYADIKIFKGRIYTWTKKTDSAKTCFKEVLINEPENIDAHVAFSDLLYWDDQYDSALLIVNSGLSYNNTSGQLLIRKAKILSNLNKMAEANTVIEKLLKMEPGNTLARSLSSRLNNEASKNKIGLSYEYYYFDKQFSDPWQIITLDYSHQTGIGSLGGHLNYANRFQKNGVQFEVDGYPRLINHVYSYFSFAYSDDVGVFPKYRGAASIYTSLPNSLEAELGFRYLYFSDATWIYTAALGKYYKNWYFLSRTYLTPSINNISQSYNLLARYYYGGADDFWGITIGTGISPDETASNVLLNSVYKLKSKKVSANYRHAFKNKYILSLSAGWVNQEYRPKTTGNQIDGGISLQIRY